MTKLHQFPNEMIAKEALEMLRKTLPNFIFDISTEDNRIILMNFQSENEKNAAIEHIGIFLHGILVGIEAKKNQSEN